MTTPTEHNVTIKTLSTGRLAIYDGPPVTGEYQSDRVMVAYLDPADPEITCLVIADPQPGDVYHTIKYDGILTDLGLDAPTIRAMVAAGRRMGKMDDED